MGKIVERFASVLVTEVLLMIEVLLII